jgi:flagellar protein FliO/FliZ
MPLWLGIVLFIVVAALLGCVAVLFMRQRSGGGAVLPHSGAGEGRLRVLESAAVDGDRRLLLVQCDQIEHLIMVGGPSDIVVEYDVGKHKVADRPSAKAGDGSAAAPVPVQAALAAKPDIATAVPEHSSAEERAPVSAGPRGRRPWQVGARDAAARTAAPRSPAPVAGAAQDGDAAAPEHRVSPVASQGGPAAVRPMQRGPVNANTPVRVQSANVAGAASAGSNPMKDDVTQKPGASVGGAETARREGRSLPGPRSAPLATPRPVPAEPDARQARRAVNAQREAAQTAKQADAAEPSRNERRAAPQPPVSLPAAEIPWPEPETMEAEVVRTLRVDPKPPLAPPLRNDAGPVRTMPTKQSTDRATTLGDIAERLDEALALEMQEASFAGSPARAGGSNPDAFGFDAPVASVATGPAASEAARARAAGAPATAPQLDLRGEPRSDADREKAVAKPPALRWQEPVDPLEDEMARLLGELTGDATRR